MRQPVLLAPMFFAFAAPLAGQAAIGGIVRDDSTARPLAGVEVLLPNTGHRATTNEAGRYELAGLPTGMYQVVVRLVGYLPVRMDVLLRDGETTRANATLVRSEVVLDPIEVTGDMSRPRGIMVDGFEERRAMGFGTFIDSEDLRRSEHLQLPDLLRRHSRLELRFVCLDNLSAPVLNCPGEKGWLAFNPTKRSYDGQLNCPIHILFDGHLVTRNGWVDLRSFTSPNELHAAEVYQSAAQIPIQFGGADVSCGVIVLWSRRG